MYMIQASIVNVSMHRAMLSFKSRPVIQKNDESSFCDLIIIYWSMILLAKRKEMAYIFSQNSQNCSYQYNLRVFLNFEHTDLF